MHIRLLDARGDLVHDQLIPVMEKAPDIITWNKKYFKFQTSRVNEQKEKQYLYAEIVVFNL